jgi:hypothetical protein
LNIVTLCHPWHRDIPFFLNIKKPQLSGFLLLLIITSAN